jgi:hypothetical protein
MNEKAQGRKHEFSILLRSGPAMQSFDMVTATNAALMKNQLKMGLLAFRSANVTEMSQNSARQEDLLWRFLSA